MNNNITTDELLMLIGELVAEKFQLRKQLAQAINRIKELEAPTQAQAVNPVNGI